MIEAGVDLINRQGELNQDLFTAIDTNPNSRLPVMSFQATEKGAQVLNDGLKMQQVRTMHKFETLKQGKRNHTAWSILHRPLSDLFSNMRKDPAKEFVLDALVKFMNSINLEPAAAA